MDVRIDPSRRDNHVFPGNCFGSRPNDNGDARLDVRIPGLANPSDPSCLDADVGFNDPRMIDDDRVGNDGVDRIFRLAL